MVKLVVEEQQKMKDIEAFATAREDSDGYCCGSIAQENLIQRRSKKAETHKQNSPVRSRRRCLYGHNRAGSTVLQSTERLILASFPGCIEGSRRQKMMAGSNFQKKDPPLSGWAGRHPRPWCTDAERSATRRDAMSSSGKPVRITKFKLKLDRPRPSSWRHRSAFNAVAAIVIGSAMKHSKIDIVGGWSSSTITCDYYWKK
jgi:hypothetical protein